MRIISLQFHFLFKFVNHEKFKVKIFSQSPFIEGGFLTEMGFKILTTNVCKKQKNKNNYV